MGWDNISNTPRKRCSLWSVTHCSRPSFEKKIFKLVWNKTDSWSGISMLVFHLFGSSSKWVSKNHILHETACHGESNTNIGRKMLNLCHDCHLQNFAHLSQKVVVFDKTSWSQGSRFLDELTSQNVFFCCKICRNVAFTPLLNVKFSIRFPCCLTIRTEKVDRRQPIQLPQFLTHKSSNICTTWSIPKSWTLSLPSVKIHFTDFTSRINQEEPCAVSRCVYTGVW